MKRQRANPDTKCGHCCQDFSDAVNSGFIKKQPEGSESPYEILTDDGFATIIDCRFCPSCGTKLGPIHEPYNKE